MFYVLVWVYDIIIGCKSKDHVNKLRDDLDQRSKMDDRGPLSWFLGMTIKQQTGAVTVSETQYIDECLRRYGLDDRKPVLTDVNSSFSRDDCPEGGSTEAAKMKGCDYRGILGCLMPKCEAESAWLYTDTWRILARFTGRLRSEGYGI